MKERPILAVVTAVASNTVQKELLDGVSSMAMALGYDTVVISNIYNISSVNKDLLSENSIYGLMRSAQFAAVIVDTEAFTNQEFVGAVSERLAQMTVPVVLVGEQTAAFADPRCICVNNDDTADLARLTAHLIEAHGFSQIDLLTGPADSAISRRRAEGYRQALRAHGLTVDETRIHYGDFWLLSGDALANQYLSGELPLPQAVVCANDCMAFGLLRTFRAGGIRVPEDVSVVCYEFSERRVYYSPVLTVCRRNWTALGRLAVQRIHALLTGTAPAETDTRGELICGTSCPCTLDDAHYQQHLAKAEEIRDHNHRTLFSTMEQELTSAKNMDEFIKSMGDYQWQIRYVDNVFLCLYADWYEERTAHTSIMTCRSIMPWMDRTPFDAHELDIAAILRREQQPAVYYFNPVFFREQYYGHLVLKYNRPDSYDQPFISWLKHVSNGLGFLRMKNDIQYLLRCQDLSDERDILTGMLNRNGLRRAYKAVMQNDAPRALLVLRVCFADPADFLTENENKVGAVLAAAQSVQQFCGSHDIACYAGRQTFLCLVRRGSDVQLLCDALSSVLMHNEHYMQPFGMNTFFCTGRPCTGADPDAVDRLLETCREEIDAGRECETRRRAMPHARPLLRVRNAIYRTPERSFEPFYLAETDASPNTLRIRYKQLFGISIHQDCIAARMAKAKYYLAVTPLSIQEIADRCGYLDHKYFQRQFSQSAGMTAGQYRAALT